MYAVFDGAGKVSVKKLSKIQVDMWPSVIRLDVESLRKVRETGEAFT